MQQNNIISYETSEYILMINNDISLEHYYLDIILRIFQYSNAELDSFIEYLHHRIQNDGDIYDFFP